jgi:hypothetical protein
MPKYMLIMRQTDAAIEAQRTADFEQIINAMGAYNTALVNAGVLLDGDGLAPEPGHVVTFGGEFPVVTDGPYGETHELFNGFWTIRVGSAEEAVEWASKAPLGVGQSLEVRRITDETDFADFADNDYIANEPELRERAAGN